MLVKQVHEKSIAFNFNIEYRKRKLNLANTLSRRFNIIKLNRNKDNNNNILLILRHKFRSSYYQSKLQKDESVFVTIKLATIIAHLNNTIIANIQITNLNKKISEKLRNILDSALSRFLIQ